MIPDEFLVERLFASGEICKAIAHVFEVHPEEVQVVPDDLVEDYETSIRIPVVISELRGGEFHSYVEFKYGRNPHGLLLSSDPSVFERIAKGLAHELGCRLLCFTDECPEGEALVVEPSGALLKVLIDESFDDDGVSMYRIMGVIG